MKEKDSDWQQELHGVNSAPQDHSDDYDSAIRMLEMCADETIEISRQDFESYVMNRWSWCNTFLATSVAYGADRQCRSVWRGLLTRQGRV